MDGTRTFKLLKEAAHRLSIWDAQQRETDENVRTGVRLLAEAGKELARFRRLEELQGMLLEVTALVGARVDAKEIETKVAQASRMADDGAAAETVGEIVSRPDGAVTDDLLRQAATRLSGWQSSLRTDDVEATLNASSHLLAEAEPALSRFRELGNVHELLTEGTTMIEAGFHAKQIDTNVERALEMVVRIEEEIAAAIAREVQALPAAERGGGSQGAEYKDEHNRNGCGPSI
jgi:hypothetical protein